MDGGLEKSLFFTVSFPWSQSFQRSQHRFESKHEYDWRKEYVFVNNDAHMHVDCMWDIWLAAKNEIQFTGHLPE